MVKLKKNSQELANEILNNGFGIENYGCGCGGGCGSGCGSGDEYGCGCGDGDDQGYGSGNAHPYKGIRYDESIMKNKKLAKQFNDLLACPTVNGILQNFVRGEGDLTIKTEEIKDPDNPAMVTGLKDGKVSITVNSKFVDEENGFNLSSDGTGSAGYKYNGTRQGTFAAVFAHESYHAQ